MKKISLEEEQNQQPEPNNSPKSLEENPQKTANSPNSKTKNYVTTVAIILAIVAGGISGFVYAQNRLQNNAKTKNTAETQAPTSKQDVQKDKVYGTKDTETFKDTVEGVMQKGGIDGEGSHHLVRPGGSAKNVYLTSSIIDLDLFVGHKVKVWGETFNAKKAGWLMDVGRVKPLELNAELPSE